MSRVSPILARPVLRARGCGFPVVTSLPLSSRCSPPLSFSPFPNPYTTILSPDVFTRCSTKLSMSMDEKEEESGGGGGASLWVRLGRPQFVVAPMVDASELAWRVLSRRHGAQLCYTPMFHSVNFVKDPRYRAESLITIKQDRPLIVQFCGNDAEALLEAGLLAQPYCDAIDINLGCPQAIAKRGRYGAFLQDDWDLLAEIVSTLNKGLSVPVTCKVRVFESKEKTVAYAKMLENAGCQMLTVHGRTREQKGPLTGIASWEHIKAVRDNVKIPVLANGNIQCLTDVERCMRVTGCDGVMTAEGSLYNPAIFEGRNPPCWEMAAEYLDLVEQYPCPRSYIRGHMFKLFQHLLSLEENSDVRELLGKAANMNEFRTVVEMFESRYLRIHEGEQPWNVTNSDYNLDLPPWLCKSYVRIPPEEHIKKLEEKVSRNADVMFDQKENQDISIGKRPRNSTEHELSKKKLKKLQKHEKNVAHGPRKIVMCQNDCKNPMGLKCSFSLCKTCCRIKCYVDHEDCVGHGILTKTRREKARKYQMDVTDDEKSSTYNSIHLIENVTSNATVQIQHMDES